MLHPSIHTLGDLHIVRANMLLYKKAARTNPQGFTDWTNRETNISRYHRYREMYLEIKKRAIG